MASIIWVSIRSTGLSVIIGSWKTIASWFPRTFRISSSESLSRSRPLKRISPPTTFPGASTSPRMENPVTVFPDPDSPTRPSTSPLPKEKLISSTALATPSRVKKWVRRCRTSRVDSGMRILRKHHGFSINLCSHF